MTWDFITRMLRSLFISSGNTLLLFGVTLLVALPLGLLLALGRGSRFKAIRMPVQLYLLIMRGTPLMLQLIFFFFGLPLRQMGLSRMGVAIIAFSLNYAAYFAEIYRGGIESVPKGQYEAADVLGFSRAQTFFRIVLPQVVKRILPPMSNEFMTLVKDTSLARVIGVIELTEIATNIQNTYATLVPLVIAGAFYLIMNFIVSQGFGAAEKRLGYYD